MRTDLMTQEAVCRRLQCTPADVDRAVADGLLNDVRFAGQIRYLPDEVETLREAFGISRQ